MLVFAWTAAPAQAQWVATPYVGTNFGDVEVLKGGPGVSVGYFGRWLGFELDFDRHMHFFKDKDVANIVPDPGGGRMIDLDTDAMSFMGNVVVPIHIKGVTKLLPYGIAGMGVIYAWFDSSDDEYDTDQTNFGFNLGGGVMYWLTDWVALRGDVRYFRALVDEDQGEGGYFKDYGFLRVSLGVTFGLPQ